MTDGVKLETITLTGKAIDEGVAYAGFVVPDTDGTLAVDERWPSDVDGDVWRITHIPTMKAIYRIAYTDAATRERAIQVAQAFYREAVKLGSDLKSEDSAKVVAAHNALSLEQKHRFWTEVRGPMDTGQAAASAETPPTAAP